LACGCSRCCGAAWAKKRGARNPGRIDPAVLRGCYEDANFVRSVTVDDIEHEIAEPTALAADDER